MNPTYKITRVYFKDGTSMSWDLYLFLIRKLEQITYIYGVR